MPTLSLKKIFLAITGIIVLWHLKAILNGFQSIYEWFCDSLNGLRDFDEGAQVAIAVMVIPEFCTKFFLNYVLSIILLSFLFSLILNRFVQKKFCTLLNPLRGKPFRPWAVARVFFQPSVDPGNRGNQWCPKNGSRVSNNKLCHGYYDAISPVKRQLLSKMRRNQPRHFMKKSGGSRWI